MPAWTQNAAPYRDPTLGNEQRVEDLLRRMTLEEKVAMVSGGGWMESKANARLGIPAIKMADGPVGVRAWFGPSALTMKANSPLPVVTSTAFPAGVTLAATWDPEILHEVGRTIADEARALGRDMMLGPGVNIVRTPLAGRNFEMYGEDPYLSSRLVVGYIQGMQGAGIIATVKHFAANNQEDHRQTIDARIDERALREIYLPAFRAAVQEAGVWSVMSAYNKLNSHWCAENSWLLTDILKKEWGFKGFVVSDWKGTHSTAPTANAGLDLEMPSADTIRRYNDDLPKSPGEVGSQGAMLTPELLLPLVKSGEVPEAAIDDKIRRLLRAIFANGLFDHPKPGGGEVDTPAQRAVARKAADEGIVLLKNVGGLLPLLPEKVHSIAVIGPNANVARTGGGGSSSVRTSHAITPLDAIRERAGSAIEVSSIESPADAAKADVALVFVGDSPEVEREGWDRISMDLPEGQDELVAAVLRANPKTVVVLNVGAPVSVEKWIDQTPAVVNAWFPGQEGGHAIADVLFGDVNPSGRLPVTFPKRLKDSPSWGHYPGENGVVEYAEGIYVGYRWFATQHIEPRFCFGHGLSYTKFEYSDLTAAAGPGPAIQVSVKVRNAGPRDGAEVVQLYIHENRPAIDRPEKELKAFRRVELRRGEQWTISFTLDRSALAYFDPAKKTWVVDSGIYQALVGASSEDIRERADFEIPGGE